MNLILLKLTVALLALLARPTTAQNARALTAAEVQEALDAHNKARSETAQANGVENMPELVWNNTVAQVGIDYLQSSGCNWGHNPSRSGTGENIAAGQRSWYEAIYRDWYKSEEPAYLGNTGGVDGHYTQVTWTSTTQLGCAYCDRTNNGYNNYYVCNYYPPGNYIGRKPWQAGSGTCKSCPSSFPGCTSNPHPGLCTANNSTGPQTTTQAPPQTTVTTTQAPPQTTVTTTQAPPQTAATTTQAPPQTTATTTQGPPQTTATTQRPPQTTVTATDPPAPEPDMVLEFRLRIDYNSVSNFDMLEASLKQQLERYYGLPQDRTDLEFAPGRRGYTRVIVTVYGAQFADEPRAAAMVSSLLTDSGALMGASDVQCVRNCGGQPASNADPVVSPEGSNVGLLAGVIAGVVVLLAGVGAGAFWFMRKRKEQRYLDTMVRETQMNIVGGAM